MKLVCPSCGFYGPPDAYMADVAASRALLLALSAPAPLAQQVQQYLRLFRPAQRALSSSRAATILEDLLPMILEAKITWRGVWYPAPVEYWRQAMDEMIVGRDRLTLPLKSHGYLLAIIAGYAAKADSANEQARIARGRGETPIGIPPSPSGRGAGGEGARAASSAAVPSPQPSPSGGGSKPARTRDGTRTGLQSLRAVLDGAPIPTQPAGMPALQEIDHE